jgi:protein-S-isoprenylcysteine O-methyltransferase Ste14
MALTLIAAAIHWSLNLGEKTRLSLAWIGALMGVVGFFVMMWSWWVFKTQHLAVCPLQRTEHLTKGGPYRFSRNPMYLGMLLMMLGLALYIGTLPFYLSALGYFAILNFSFVPYEEHKLANAFGVEYREYRGNVRRWL